MVKNDYIGHWEDPRNPWYTPEGAAAAAASNVLDQPPALHADTAGRVRGATVIRASSVELTPRD